MKWSDIEAADKEKGIQMDGCGQTERCYYNGSFLDFCGFDPLKEKCYAGYYKDNLPMSNPNN